MLATDSIIYKKWQQCQKMSTSTSWRVNIPCITTLVYSMASGVAWLSRPLLCGMDMGKAG
jgi:hypothetical protein